MYRVRMIDTRSQLMLNIRTDKTLQCGGTCFFSWLSTNRILGMFKTLKNLCISPLVPYNHIEFFFVMDCSKFWLHAV